MAYYNYDTGAFRGYCVLCGTGFSKRELDRVYISNGRYGPHRLMAYICRDCSSKVADYLGVELPDVDGETQKRKLYEYTFCPKCWAQVKKTDRYCRYCGNRLEEAQGT